MQTSGGYLPDEEVDDSFDVGSYWSSTTTGSRLLGGDTWCSGGGSGVAHYCSCYIVTLLSCVISSKSILVYHNAA